MSAETLSNIVADFVNSIAANDIDRTLSLCTDQTTWIVPEGTLSGKNEIKQYIIRLNDLNQNIEIKDTGIGLIIRGNECVHEYIFKGTTSEGMPWTVLALSIYEFNGNKIKRIITVFDRLALVRQTAKGRLVQMAVNSVVNHAERGMR